MKKNKEKYNIPNKATTQPKYIKGEATPTIDPIEEDGNDKYVFLSLKNIQPQYQCFSDWDKTAMSKFWDFSRKLHQSTWTDIYRSAGNKNKTGFAYTPIPLSKYHGLSNLDKEVSMFELRVDDKIRVHGFRQHSIFHLCVLDKNHNITAK